MLTLLRRFAFSKVVGSTKEALKDLKDGSKLLVGGFGISGIPMNLIHQVEESGVKNLTVVSNNAGIDGWGLGVLLRTHQIKRMISSYVGENREFQRQYLNGELEVELVPQGTLAEKIRSGGAGIPAFYTPTGYKTLIQEGNFPIKYKLGGKEVQIASQPREVKSFNGSNYVLQETIVGDFALVKAQKADKQGNLVYNKSARNFNQDMATAAKCVIAQVEEIVDQIDPDLVHTPGIYVDKIVLADKNSPFSQKLIEKKTTKSGVEVLSSVEYDKSTKTLNKVYKKPKAEGKADKGADLKHKIVQRAAKEVKDGMTINLGIGIPTLLPNYLPKNMQVVLHSENGVLGYGEYPDDGKEDPDLINAGKETITLKKGASFFSSSQSFAMVRGGHLDLTILGALQISETGDIANWIIPGSMVKGMGGAMDLVACKSRVIVVMEHTAKQAHKLLTSCTLPLTANGVVSMVITEKAVFENVNGKLVLTEVAEGSSLEQVQSLTSFKIQARPNLKTF